MRANRLGYTVVSSALAILFALTVSGVILAVSGNNPFEAYGQMFEYGVRIDSTRLGGESSGSSLFFGDGGSARVQDGALQHRRGGPVPDRSADRGRCWGALSSSLLRCMCW